MIGRVIESYFVTIILFCEIYAKHNDYVRSENETYSDDVDYAESPFIRKKWISELFFEAQTVFKMDPAENTACKKDFDLFKLHLRNHSTWAVKMMESSEWPLAGIFSGTVDHLGNYDQCLAISSYGIKGRYCLAIVRYSYSDTAQSEVLEELDQRISAWNTLSVVWWFLGDVMWCYLMGLAFYLIVKAPILNLRILVKKQLSKIFMKSEPDKHIADSKKPVNQ